MSRLYSCSKCKNLFPLTETHFFKHLIRSCEKNPNKTALHHCKICANEYGKNYRNELKSKNLTRKNTPPKYRTHGILYIIGTTPNNPVKIGITCGNSITKRLTNLQTSHWLDLKILYESPVLVNVNKVEKELHEEFSEFHVRGEWYHIPEEKLNFLVEDLGKKFLNP